uniref:Uncharacterized protein n=1 Tax=Kalanchoe fedtschenkoi TaxID=63787 RepID=A0A7N0RG40_KALFE
MAKGCRGRRRVASRQVRYAPYLLPNCNMHASEAKKCPKALANDWQDATCSVCMECPHNAVLLLCSSHDKGCRPYMCGTSLRFSNCLDQYKKAYTKVTSMDDEPSEKCEMSALACPLCRGQVKGWVVVEPARKHLNSKRRSCMQDGCSFAGTYKELRRHVRSEHPSACPREVDPAVEQKWRRLEREREHDDVISTIRSSMPGAVVFGDYVIEGNEYDSDSSEEEGYNDGNGQRSEGFGVGFDGTNMVNILLFLHALSPDGNAGNHRRLIRASRGRQTSEDGLNLNPTPADQETESDSDNGIAAIPNGMPGTLVDDNPIARISRRRRR